jgi:hypothetical protein
MLRPIGFQSLDEALPLLSHGFPEHPHSFWTAGLARLKRHGAADPASQLGYLLHVDGRDVGVILTIPSTRTKGAEPRMAVVNLSSWYIDERHRWRGPRMLQQVVANESTLYTDLTATKPVRAMIGRFGFRSWTEGTLIFPLPVFAIRPAGNAQIVPFHKLGADALEPEARRMLEDHASIGCIAAALDDNETLQPLIFSRTTRRGLPIARLIYAENLTAVTRNMAAISRFLLREKALLLAIKANPGDRIAGSIFMPRSSPAFFKGKTAPPQCDLAYSEYAFLQM